MGEPLEREPQAGVRIDGAVEPGGLVGEQVGVAQVGDDVARCRVLAQLDARAHTGRR